MDLKRRLDFSVRFLQYTRMKDLSKIQWIFYDLDGTLYSRYLRVGKRSIAEFCDHVMTEVAERVFPDTPREVIAELAKNSYRQYGDCHSAFLCAAKGWPDLQGVHLSKLRDTLFSLYHSILYHWMTRDAPEIFADAARAVPYLERMNGRVQHGVLTHSSREDFAEPFLRESGLDSHIQTVFGMAEIGFRNKGQTFRPMADILAHFNADPARTAFLEDTPHNLWVAKQRYPQLTTIYVTHGVFPERCPAGVDLMVSTVPEALDLIAQAVCNRAVAPEAAGKGPGLHFFG